MTVISNSVKRSKNDNIITTFIAHCGVNSISADSKEFEGPLATRPPDLCVNVYMLVEINNHDVRVSGDNVKIKNVTLRGVRPPCVARAADDSAARPRGRYGL